MAEAFSTNYRSMTDMEQADMTVPWEKFFVHVAGKTNNAHQDFVKKLRGIGKNQVSSFGEGDFLVVFCPVVSRVGTDINVAMKGIPGRSMLKIDPERVVAPSRRQVDDPNVRLTVDCLFHEDRLLTCDLNREAWAEVQKLLGSSRPVVPHWKRFLSKGGFWVIALDFAWSWWSWCRDRLAGWGVAVGAGAMEGAGGDKGRKERV
ncbi:uncharacterized protein LOC117727818 [Cyclopterus lumpus]|uniref:uncharacterized protein LOC117727818 n=1 Tax=Cyclopterus lumpus TaxID=8103 RepID=UPI0014862181|nr:uncharacterized protein LOC117727818 [Cyclopterus lumpus]